MSFKWPSDRIDTEKLIHDWLEKIRIYNRCRTHQSGDMSIVYSAKHKSWIVSCEETAETGSTQRSDGKCFWHTHFDPSDWEH